MYFVAVVRKERKGCGCGEMDVQRLRAKSEVG